jgi:hypothetical protein
MTQNTYVLIMTFSSRSFPPNLIKMKPAKIFYKLSCQPSFLIQIKTLSFGVSSS